MPAINNTDNAIDMCNVLSCIEELKLAVSMPDALEADRNELDMLTQLVEDVADASNDHPNVVIINDNYFAEHAKTIAEQCEGTVFASWPYNCIDWELAASKMLQSDYSSVDFDGATYWVAQ